MKKIEKEQKKMQEKEQEKGGVVLEKGFTTRTLSFVWFGVIDGSHSWLTKVMHIN